MDRNELLNQLAIEMPYWPLHGDLPAPPIKGVWTCHGEWRCYAKGDDLAITKNDWLARRRELSTEQKRLEKEGTGPFAEHYSAPWFLEQGLLHMESRAATYDKQSMGGERSMQACVDAFIAITGDGMVTTAERGWLFMVLLKLTRSQQGQFRSDNYEDAAAYCGLMGESAASERV